MALRTIIMTRMRRYVMEGDRVFINFTNHPSGGWGEEQMLEAKRYGEVIDLTFPEVDPYGDKKYVTKLADASGGCTVSGRILSGIPGGCGFEGEGSEGGCRM